MIKSLKRINFKYLQTIMDKLYQLKTLNPYDYLFAILVFSLPFSPAIPNIVLGFLFFLFVLDIKNISFKKLNLPQYFTITILISYLILKAAFNNSFLLDFTIYSRFFILLIIPLLFLKLKNINLFYNSIIFSVNVMILISIYKIVSFYIKFHILPLYSGYDVNRLMLIERPYAGFFVVIGCLLSLKKMTISQTNKKYFLLSSILSVGYIFLISARISFLSLLAALSIYLLFYLKISNYKKLIYFILISLLLSLSFSLNKNISDRFFIKQNIKESLKFASNYEPRIIIWDCAYKIINEKDFNYFFGLNSYSDICQKYLNCYSNTISNQQEKIWFLDIKFNSHNQFIDLFLIGGIIAIFLMVLYFFLMLFSLRRHFFELAIVISFIMFFAVENVLHRQFGCYIFSIFAGMFMMNNYLVNEKN